MVNFIFFYRRSYQMNTDADEWLSQLDHVLRQPAKSIFSPTTDIDIFRGYLRGYSFSIQREMGWGNRSRFSNLTVEGTVNWQERIVEVAYHQDWGTLTYYVIFDLAMLLIAVLVDGLPLYLRLLFPVTLYLFQLLRFNYELSLAINLIEWLCRPGRA